MQTQKLLTTLVKVNEDDLRQRSSKLDGHVKYKEELLLKLLNLESGGIRIMERMKYSGIL